MNNFKSEWISLEKYLKILDKIEGGKSTIYHQYPWIQSVSIGFGCQFKFLHTCDAKGTLALTPFMYIKKGPFSLLGSPLSGMFTEFAGPVFVTRVDEESQRAIILSQNDHLSVDHHYIEWGAKGAFNVDIQWGTALIEQGYSLILRPSLLIELSLGEKAVWDGFKSRARNMIRKAEKADLIANTVTPDETWIKEYFDLLKFTFEKQGLSVPHPFSFYQQIQSLAHKGLALCVDVQINGELVAGAIFLKDKDRMMYFSGVASREGMRLAAPSLIQWHAMKKAMQTNVTEYDMGGLGVESIDKFKQSFGGYEVQHFRWIYRSKIFKAIEPVGRWLAKKGLVSLGGS